MFSIAENCGVSYSSVSYYTFILKRQQNKHTELVYWIHEEYSVRVYYVDKNFI